MPFYEARGGTADADRLLLISDQFPPAQSAGALRWQKLARYAADRGWALDVITRDPAHLSGYDDSRLAELPPGTRVYAFSPHELLLDRVETGIARAYRGVQRERASAAPPAAGDAGRGAGAQHAESSVAPEDITWQPASPRFWMRSYWALMDHRRQLAWARDVERVGRRVLDRAKHRAVISCGPWHLCNHEAARRLARRARLPFIMDLRDPWSLPRRINEPIATPLWFLLARHYESRAVHEAALVVVNAEPVERAMRERYPAVADRLMTVTNGYDEDPMPESRHGGRFTIAYAGGIYLDRDPRPLFRAASRVIESLGLQPDEFGIEMIGNVDDYGGVPIGRMAEEEGIAPYVHTGPLRPRTEALELLAGATVLLSLPQDSPWAIPSKIFEYMQFDAWILVMAEPDAPAALLLQGTTADIVAPSDVEGIAKVLRERYEQFARGERPARLSHDKRFSRRHQAERLMEAIARHLSPRRQAEPAVAARPLARAAAGDAAR